MHLADVTTAAEAYARAAERFRRHRAIHNEQHGWLTFGDLDRAAATVVTTLAENDVVPGDRVVVHLPNSALMRVVEHGLLTRGIVRVAVSDRLRPREVVDIARDCAARVVVTSPDRRAALVELLDGDARVESIDLDELLAASSPPPPQWDSPAVDDLAMLLYSSGTTGRPKAATVSQRAWLDHARSVLGILPALDGTDTILIASPMAHFAGSMSLDCSLAGVATIALPRYRAADVAELISRGEVTVLAVAPVMLDELARVVLDEGVSTGSLKAVVYGGSPTPPTTVRRAARAFPGSLHQFYGLSEALAPITCLPPSAHDEAARALDASGRDDDAWRILASAGRPVAGVEVSLAAAPEDDPGVGTVRIRGTVVTSGYWCRPSLTRDSLSSDGWFTTSDVGRMGPGSLLEIIGRRDDVIISGGFNIHPGEVETVLVGHPDVREAAVVPVPHPRWGQAVAAVIVPRSALTDAERGELVEALRDACRERIASYKKPLSYRFADALPRNAHGKLDRRAVLERWDEIEPAAAERTLSGS